MKRIAHYLGRLLNRTIQGAVACTLLVVVGMLLDKALLGDKPKRHPVRPGASEHSDAPPA